MALVLAVAAPGVAAAACLGGGEMRQAVASGQALPLGAIKGRVGGEIVRADLCQRGGGLVYSLSVLTGGKVDEVIVDARTGAVISRR